MDLLGVGTSLAPRISEEFESLILHQILAVAQVRDTYSQRPRMG